MPLTVSVAVTTVATCDLCADTLVHVVGTLAPLALDYFFANHWDVLPSEQLDGKVTVVCPRCKPVMATITRSIDHDHKAAEV